MAYISCLITVKNSRGKISKTGKISSLPAAIKHAATFIKVLFSNNFELTIDRSKAGHVFL